MERQQILLIDPQQSLRQALTRLLTRFEYELVYAASPQLAFKVLHKKPDIALALVSHDVTGLSAAETVKALRRWKESCPAIFLAPPGREEEFRELHASGPTAVATLPLDLAQLLLVINRLLQQDPVQPQYPGETVFPLVAALDAKVFFTVTDISETGCHLRSHIPFERNSILVLQSPELANRLNLPAEYNFPMRVCGCVRTAGTHSHSVSAQFVGMSAEARTRLRSACLSAKGFKFNGSSK